MPNVFYNSELKTRTLGGATVPSGKLYFYKSGTSTLQAVYADPARSTTLSNPVIANSSGEVPTIYPDPAILYRVRLTDSASAPVWDDDSVMSPYFPRTDEELSVSANVTDFACVPLDPQRYGAVGDGAADDTTALNTMIAVLNASLTPCCIWPSGKTFLCAPLNAITATDLTLQANGSRIKVKADSWSTVDTPHFSLLNAHRARLYALTIDGNQAAFSVAGSVGRLLDWTYSNDVWLIGCTFTQSAHTGARCSTGTQSRLTDCHFDDNASLGLALGQVSYFNVKGCTFNRNGYGFQQTFDPEVQGGAFGLAIRFRSHHLTFVDCVANENGRDGLNVNQGSYAIKFIGCVCWRNNDGGFTVAADQTNSGNPGEAESCYDLEYVDCEAYNSYTSGLAIYSPSYNITVTGGRYYNNHRCAGLIDDAASFNCGIFVAGTSLGINITTKAYDDRQLRLITSISGTGSTRTIAATGWVEADPPVLPRMYPRLAFYDANNAFQGYATMMSETPGTITVTPTARNAVTLASISAGWRITQRLQHNGVMYSNGASGSAIVDAFGQLPGISQTYGYPVMASWNDNGQNVVVPDRPLDANNLLINPTFDSGIANWSLNASGGSFAHETGTLRRSAGALRLTAGASADAYGDASLDADVLKHIAGAFIEATIWAYCDAPGGCNLRLYYKSAAGSLYNTLVDHPGGGWKLLRIGAHMAPDVSQVIYRVEVARSKTCYYDTASLRVRGAPVDERDFAYPTRSLPQ